MFRLTSRALSSGKRTFATYKTSTGLVGLSVDPNGRETLLSLSQNILKNVQKIPQGVEYRTDVEKWFSFIHSTAEKETDIKKIEDCIELGQIEEVIEMAKNEMTLIDYYFDNKIWEAVAEAQLEADEILANMADVVYFTSAEAHGEEPPVEAPKVETKA